MDRLICHFFFNEQNVFELKNIFFFFFLKKFTQTPKNLLFILFANFLFFWTFIIDYFIYIKKN